MDFKKLANKAKSELDKRGGADKLKELGDKAKHEYERRGGTEGLKESAKQVVDAAKTEGSAAEKAKAAAAAAKEAVKTPGPGEGAAGGTAAAPHGDTGPVAPTAGVEASTSAGGSVPTNFGDDEIPGGTSSKPGS
ncbi:MAG: hypothetical protein GX856_02525 [Gammaproteobacteria bacterium]|nr:hypothetical protein [Gammaproteobacteria bacterium]